MSLIDISKFPVIEEPEEIVWPEDEEGVEPTESAPEGAASEVPAEEPVSEPAASEVPAEPAASEEGAASSAPTEEDVASLRERAQKYEQWSEIWARDPKKFMETYFHALPAEVQREFLQAVNAGSSVTPVEGDAADWEPQTEIEADYLKHRDMVRKLPEFTRDFAQAVQEQIAQFDPYINDAHIRLAEQDALIGALMEALDVRLPRADRASIEKALASSPGLSYAEAVKRAYQPTLSDHLKRLKQAKLVRPKTPGTGSGDNISRRKSGDILDYFRDVSLEG